MFLVFEIRRRSWAAAAALLLLGSLGAAAMAENAPMRPPFPIRKPVPPLPDDSAWLNSGGPISWQQLRGKFVLLDFWTYCCINCMHILPELKKLEQKYPRELVVIGVHSAKFETERDADNITEAVLRYGIEHPVINDHDMRIWRTFGVNAWPTLVLIDPQGYAVWAASGETTFEALDELISRAMPFYEKQNLLDRTPVRFDTAARRAPRTPLRFPGKVAVDEESGRLFIADSSHNRIIVAGMDGVLQAVIGSGKSGFADGGFDEARFSQPQGMAVRGNVIFVADTENHAIRRIDLAERSVTTIAGTGRQLRQAPAIDPRPAKNINLSSPWDLFLADDFLYVAMAGCHQIWRMNLKDGRIGVYAGNAVEDIVDGRRLPPAAYRMGFASFAQPSGLASDGNLLFVADSEGSSIRAVPFDPRKEVKTVVGTSHLAEARLFTFGDVDGPATQALLQHPLGVAFHAGRLYVADTYNSKIKVVDPAEGTTKTLVGTGKPGAGDDPPQFNEPAGISAAAGRLFVADTNNHLVRVVDLSSGKVSTLNIAGLQPPARPEGPEPLVTFPGTIEQRLAPANVKPQDGAIRLAVTLELAPPYKINPLAPLVYQVDRAADDEPSGQGEGKASRAGPVQAAALGRPVVLKPPAASFEITLPVDDRLGRDTLRVTVNYYYCRDGADGVCKAAGAVWIVPIQFVADAQTAVIPLRHRPR